ncbi:hypothetical protein SDC9_211554 [bioreactor metagenome]|uniref:Uncharacterized protein n=1 Tax=bioreactor metagenome TaxID=1076179 RepID=A0A645JJD6_9ZZZZ
MADLLRIFRSLRCLADGCVELHSIADTQIHVVDGHAVRHGRGLGTQVQFQWERCQQSTTGRLQVLHAGHQGAQGVDSGGAQHKGTHGVGLVVRVVNAYVESAKRFAPTFNG